MAGDAPAAADPHRSGAKTFLPNIQILRFLAAFMVLISHLDREVRKDGVAGAGVDAFDRLAFPWSCGVDLFFAISGFIMLYLTWNHFHKERYWFEFLKRRFIRVVPLYWMFTLVFALIAVLQPQTVSHAEISIGHVLASLLFIPYARSDGSAYPVLALGWTLNYEILFYLAFAVMLLATAALKVKRSMALVSMGGLFLVVSLLNPSLAGAPLVLRFWSSPIIMEFVFGVGVAWLHLRGVRLPGHVRAGCLIVGVALLAAAGLFAIADTEVHVSPLPRSIWAGLPCALILAGAVLGPQLNADSPATRLAVLGGDASYSLYLTHMFATRSLTIAWRLLGLGAGVGFMVAGAAAALALAVAVYLWVESPILALLRRRFEPTRALVAA